MASLDDAELEQLSCADEASALAKMAIHMLKPSSHMPDKRICMELEGALRFWGMLKNAGGLYSTDDVVELLSKTSQAIRKDVDRKKLIRIEWGGEYKFPVFQFENGEVLPSIANVLKVLPDSINAIGTVRFFLTPVEEGCNMASIDLLRAGQEEYVIAFAKHYQNHF